MKRLCLSVLTAGLLLAAPFSAAVSYAAEGSSPPPVGQTLVREGDYAVRLLTVLKLGTTDNEADAENTLDTKGINPKNGWISDFPVTPDIVAELKDSVMEAAEAGKLPVGSVDALRLLTAMNAEMGLGIMPGTAEEGGVAPTLYDNQDTVDDYYTEQGPPVVTYYPPPPDYEYLYAWDPYPFWWGGFWFPGYYILNDFDVVIFDYDHDGRHRHHHDRDDFRYYRDHDRDGDGHHHGRGDISNHVPGQSGGGRIVLDPVTRRPSDKKGTGGGPAYTGGRGPNGWRVAPGQGGIAPKQGGGGTFDRGGASGIVRRSIDRTGGTSGGGSWGRPGTNATPTVRGGRPAPSAPGGRMYSTPSVGGGRVAPERGGGGRTFTPERGGGGRTFAPPSGYSGRSMGDTFHEFGGHK